MLQKVQGAAPFQVLTNAFSISPSNEGYDLQISSDGFNYSTLFSVGAGVTRMVTGVANGSYYRLLGNESEVIVNWNRSCGGGGSEGSGGTPYILPIASASELGGIKVGDGLAIDPSTGVLSVSGGSQGGDSHILLSSSAAPSSLGVGDVYAFDGDVYEPVSTAKTFSSITITFTGKQVRFKMYCEGQGGYTSNEAGINSDGTISDFGWGYDNGIISGPWGSEYGIQVDIDGDQYTFTTLNPDNDYQSCWMYDFTPAVYETVHKTDVRQMVISGDPKLVYSVSYSDVEDFVNDGSDNRIYIDDENLNRLGTFRMTGDTFVYRDTASEEKVNYQMDEFTSEWSDSEIAGGLHFKVDNGIIYIYSEDGALNFSPRMEGGDFPEFSSESVPSYVERSLAFADELPDAKQLLPSLTDNDDKFLQVYNGSSRWVNINQVPSNSQQAWAVDMALQVRKPSEYENNQPQWVMPRAYRLLPVEQWYQISRQLPVGSVWSNSNGPVYISGNEASSQFMSYKTYEQSFDANNFTGFTKLLIVSSEGGYAAVKDIAHNDAAGVNLRWNTSAWELAGDWNWETVYNEGTEFSAVTNDSYALAFHGYQDPDNNNYMIVETIPETGLKMEYCEGNIYVAGMPINTYDNLVRSADVVKIWKGTQAEYSALGSGITSDTLYIII